MLRIPGRLGTIVCSLALLSFLFAACGSTNSVPLKAIPATHDFTITAGHSFSPFIQAVPANTTVAFINDDSVNHDLVSTLDSNSFLNPIGFSSMLAPHSEQETTFTQPGIYDIYDDVFGSWNADEHRVVALQQVPIAGASPFPSTIECILWVQGDITGLPATAQISLMPNTDNFDTNFTAITKGGTVSWQNAGKTPFTVQTAPGWAASINPVAIPPTTIAASARTLTFNTPGLYYYYSPTYADVDPTTHRAIAHANAADYPIPAEGFVLVI